MLVFHSAGMLSKFNRITFLILFTGCSRIEFTEPAESSTPPVIPTGLTVNGAFDGMIGISWNNNDEPGIYGYDVFRASGTNQNFSFIEKPELISPADNSEVTVLQEFRIQTIAHNIQYKIVIQNSPVGGVAKEINFQADEPGKEKSISASGLHLEGYKTYFWRVMTFSNSNSEPNSYSKLFSFYYNPK